jgi:hypothetical protein
MVKHIIKQGDIIEIELKTPIKEKKKQNTV